MKSRGSARVGIDFLPHLMGFEAVPGDRGNPGHLGGGGVVFSLFDWEP